MNLNCEPQKTFGMVFGYSEETALIKNLIRGIQNHVKYTYLVRLKKKLAHFKLFSIFEAVTWSRSPNLNVNNFKRR